MNSWSWSFRPLKPTCHYALKENVAHEAYPGQPKFAPAMSETGHWRRCDICCVMPALLQKADIHRRGRQVGFAPMVGIAPIAQRRKMKRSRYRNEKEWCPGAESNHRHCDFQSRLPTFAKPMVSRNLPYVRIKTLIISSIFVDAPRQRTHTHGHWSELIVRTQCGHEHESGKPNRRND
jgi:hypothetical protein